MSYSLAKLDNHPEEFPPPPEWLVWMQDYEYNRVTRQYEPTGKGQVRHMPTLFKAKKRVADYMRYDPEGTGLMRLDWAIYKWDGTEYVLQYAGKRGEVKKDNALFMTIVPKNDGDPKRKSGGLEVEVAEAIDSIARTFQTAV